MASTNTGQEGLVLSFLFDTDEWVLGNTAGFRNVGSTIDRVTLISAVSGPELHSRSTKVADRVHDIGDCSLAAIEDGTEHQIPIVFITAHSDESVRPELLARGAAECLFKPFSETALIDALNTALRMR